MSHDRGNGDDMARRRLQQKGNLYRSEGGMWKLRWREDVRLADGSTKRAWSHPVDIGPARGAAALTKKEAIRKAWADWLSKIDQNNHTPKSIATLAEFVDRKFRPEHIDLAVKHSTRIGYESILRAHILPALGALPLRDITRDDIQALIGRLLAAGRAPQTAYHIRNVMSAIFRLAEDCEWSQGNPARRVRLPELTYEKRRALTHEEFLRVMANLKEPYRAMVAILARTGMRMGELVGLRWKWVNLTDRPMIAGHESIPPYTIAVRESFVKGQWTSVKKSSSYRHIPITTDVWVELAERPQADPNATVFANRRGGPLDSHNIANRHFRPAAKAAGVPWASLHCLRHTAASATDGTDMSLMDRMRLLGHADVRTTARYTHGDLERVRRALETVQ